MLRSLGNKKQTAYINTAVDATKKKKKKSIGNTNDDRTVQARSNILYDRPAVLLPALSWSVVGSIVGCLRAHSRGRPTGVRGACDFDKEALVLNPKKCDHLLAVVFPVLFTSNPFRSQLRIILARYKARLRYK